MKTILVWYRNDLRVSDHEPLSTALAEGAQVVVVYCFDPRHFETTAFGFKKTDAFRAQFLLESLADLRDVLRASGSDLVVRIGLPEVVLPQLAHEVNASAVYAHQEVGTEEQTVETALANVLKQENIKLTRFWGHTLHHKDDLPFAIGSTPEVFTQFRVAVEKNVPAAKVHRPDALSVVEQGHFGVRIGTDYPAMMVDLFESAKANKEIYDRVVSLHLPNKRSGIFRKNA